MQRFDKYWIGIVLGLLMPALVAYVYLVQFNLLDTFLQFGLALSLSWSKLLMVSVFPDLAFIFVFYTAEMWKVSKGLLIGAFPYLIAAMVVVL